MGDSFPVLFRFCFLAGGPAGQEAAASVEEARGAGSPLARKRDGGDSFFLQRK